ncbi:MAG: hypothetical protein U1F56_13865 [Rubrivivax sp.]
MAHSTVLPRAYVGAHVGQQVAARLRVEPHGRLVHQHQRGPVQQRAQQPTLRRVPPELAHRPVQFGRQAAGRGVGLDALARQRRRQPVQRAAWKARLRRTLRSRSSDICWNTTPMWRSARQGSRASGSRPP